jgi:hypothetical protein
MNRTAATNRQTASGRRGAIRFLAVRPPPALPAPIYYVDATGGNDSNDGLTSGTPWRTLAKVRVATFVPGDTIALKRGESWTDGLTINQSGTAGHPITFTAYGIGALPKIDGANLTNCIYAIGKSYINLDSLDLARGLDHGAKFDGCDHIVVTDCTMHGAGNDNLIFINDCSYGTVLRGTYHDAYRRVSSYFATGIEIADNGSTFLVDGVECYGNADAGITVHNHGPSDPQGSTNVPDLVTIQNVTSHASNGIGFNTMTQGPTTPLHITILNSTFDGNTLDGIRATRVGSAAGTSNIIANLLIDRCTVLDNSRYGIYAEADDLTIQRTRITSARFLRLVDCVRTKLRNVTIYAALWNGWHPIYVDGARGDWLDIKNCIILCDETAAQNIALTSAFAPASKQVSIDFTLWSPNTLGNNRMLWGGTAYTYANWKTTSGQDSHSPIPADPLFIDKTAYDFRLQAASPAINAGVDVGLPYLGAAPDLGYAEKA